jgi:hypothetical protein
MSGKIKRNGDILTAPMDEMLLMMSVEQGKYFGLNGAGPRIWELLEQPLTEDELVAALLDEYEVTREVCAAEVAAFLAGLRERHLLVDVP